MSLCSLRKPLIGLMFAVLLLGCVSVKVDPTEITPTEENHPNGTGLTAPEEQALSSLTKVDDFPLYIMRSSVNYRASDILLPDHKILDNIYEEWACSLFAALGDGEHALYGRNFDWKHSPALLLITDPPNAFTSVSMVNLAFFMPEEKIQRLTDLPIDQLTELLDAPYWPIDGMNEHGLVVGMAAVPDSDVPIHGEREWISSLGIIREMLDAARNVDEAIDVVRKFNISMEGGPHIHYLLADASGRAVLVELYKGELKRLPNNEQWHAVTNFTISAISGKPEGQCWRYDTLIQQLENKEGRLTSLEAMNLLSDVSQENTQWSVVYALSTLSVNISMGRDYNDIHQYPLIQ
jgi:choloylglycine hydrolase